MLHSPVWSRVLFRAACLTIFPGILVAPEAVRGEPGKPGQLTPGKGRLEPFLQKYCVRCHGPEKQRARIAVDALGELPGSGPELVLWKRLLGQLESGHMPPDEARQPSREERREVIGSLREKLAKVGVRWEGNEADHDALFASKEAPRAPVATEGRLWRLSQPAYENLLKERLRGTRSTSRLRAPWEMVPDPKTGFSDLASSHRIGEAELEHHLRNVLPVAREVMSGRAIPELQALARSDRTATPKQITEAVTGVFLKILQRKPTEAEQQRYAGFVRKVLDSAGAQPAAEQLLLAALLHPEVLYRVEAAGKETESLTPHHLARAIAYTLTDHGPDEVLLEAASTGKLSTPDEVHAQVLRILDSSATSRLRILRFFQEYFGYTSGPDVFKDAPTLHAAEVVPDVKMSRKEGTWAEASYTFVRDTDWLILHILDRDREVLRELLTTRDTFTMTKPERGPRPLDAGELLRARTKYREGIVSRGFFRGVPLPLRIYELEELAIRRDAWAPDRPFPMPEGHRRGILTHPSWLVARSENFDNSAIHRGKWIRERLLGEKVPDIPITVDAKLPDEPHHTLRERMRVTRESYCWKCHQKMDPLGLPFEIYDHFGRFRTTELGQPVDATGHLEGTEDPRLDGPVKDANDLIGRLAASERVEQVFVRHVFRYFVGRNETLADGPVLVRAQRAYRESGGSMKALLASLLTSDAFLQRVPASEKDTNPSVNRRLP